MVYGSLPKWIDNRVISEIIKNKLNKNSSIVLKVEDNEGSSAGDHYLSEIIHFTVTFRVDELEEKLNLVLKDMGSGLSDFVKEVRGAEKEISMYKDIVPFIHKMLPVSIAPELYFYKLSEKSLILEDLSALGYVMTDRMALLDYGHSEVAIKALAQLHASTVGLYEVSPHIFETVGEETAYKSTNTNGISYHFARNNIKNVIEMLEGLPEGHQFVEGVRQFSTTFWDDIILAINNDYSFKVLNHGDFWTTNILFKYEVGKVTECKFVDFQMTRFCTPTLDLFQMITISMQPDVRDNRLSDLLQIYVDILNQTLKSLGSSSNLQRQDLDRIMEETKVFGLFDCLMLTQIALCDPDDPLELCGVSTADFQQGFPRGDPYAKAYKQTQVQRHIVSLLNFFRNKNYI